MKDSKPQERKGKTAILFASCMHLKSKFFPNVNDERTRMFTSLQLEMQGFPRKSNTQNEVRKNVTYESHIHMLAFLIVVYFVFVAQDTGHR